MIIKNYEVIINEKNAQCGVVIDLEEYDINFLKDQKLFYNVNNKEKMINVLNKNKELLITFLNADQELIYYAFKTINLSILGGVTKPESEITLILSAELV